MRELVNSLIDFLYSIRFSDFADLLSVISFGLTIYVLLTIRKIKTFYVFNARVPDLLKGLAKQNTQLLSLYNQFEESKPQILLHISSTQVTLDSLSKKVDKNIQASIKEVATQISSYKSSEEKNELWKIYVELAKVHQEITHLLEDRKWESNNA